MEIKGKIVSVLDLQKGTSARGPWQKRYAVIETESGRYAKKICLMFWGDLAEHQSLQNGTDISAAIDIESREYNGRWYTDVKVKSIQSAGSVAPNSQSSAVPPPPPPAFDHSADPFDSGEAGNDLPF